MVTGKELVSTSNIKTLWRKLFSDAKLAQKLRKNMGLGDTLGPLEPEYGGLGNPVNRAILNPALGWKFPLKKVIETAPMDIEGQGIGGTIGQKYYGCFKTSTALTPTLRTITDNGVVTDTALTELNYSQQYQQHQWGDDYSVDETTHLCGQHGTRLVLYSFNKAGLKSVIFNEKLATNNLVPFAVDNQGNVFAVTRITSTVIEGTYFKKGSPSKKFSISHNGVFSDNSIHLTMVNNIVFLTSNNIYNLNVASINLETQQFKVLAHFSNGSDPSILRIRNQAYFFIRTSQWTGYFLNENDIGPSFFLPIATNSSGMEFNPSGKLPSGKNMGVSPCGTMVFDNNSMSLCPMIPGFQDGDSRNLYFGKNHEIMNFTTRPPLRINIFDVVKL